MPYNFRLPYALRKRSSCFFSDRRTSSEKILKRTFLVFFLNENGEVVAVEELLVMVGNVLEPAAAEVVEAAVAEVLKSAAAGLVGVGLKH